MFSETEAVYLKKIGCIAPQSEHVKKCTLSKLTVIENTSVPIHYRIFYLVDEITTVNTVTQKYFLDLYLNDFM